ncbi:MAG TPA: FRG domain-containing protein [Nitrospiraceae bacterium]|nr:FRG domain-containing protein [Nitrospiraceae bacterium]
MKEIDLKCWEEFEEHIYSLSPVKGNSKQVENRTYVTPIFRGHANASWELESTLDRVFKRDVGMEEYFKTIQDVRPAVISITGKEWNVPDDFYEDQFAPQGIDFMVYLRHHGFPSPLLDWTRSPFVAAYFAFRSYEDRNDGKVALFSYAEYLEIGVKYPLEDKGPTIYQLGSHVVREVAPEI